MPSQVAAAALLWDALLTPQRRESFFYGELAALHPAAGAATGDGAAGSTTPSIAATRETSVEPSLRQARFLRTASGLAPRQVRL